MADKLDAKRIAAMVDDGDADLGALVSSFERDPSARSVLGELLSWRTGSVRFWALGVAKRVYPRDEYIQALDKAVRDRDETVRDDAIGELADLAPEHVRRFERKLVSRLEANIPFLEKGFVLWTLAKIKAFDAIPAIAKLRSEEPGWTKLARVADVVSMYLTEGEQAVLDRIRQHTDHARMEELCTMAWHVLATPEAREVLTECAGNAPDEECRTHCSFALRRWDFPD